MDFTVAEYPPGWNADNMWHSTKAEVDTPERILKSINECDEAPDYQKVFDWMRDIPNPSVSYDIWARGQYTRRIAELRRSNQNPMYVPVRNLAEMQWAYRRLALLGVPVEFVFQSSVSRPSRALHLYPGEPDVLIDSGWGYVATPGAKFRGRDWLVVTGRGNYLDDRILRWLYTEAADAFLQGNLFISPSCNVGLEAFVNDSSHPLAQLTNGTTAGDVQSQAEFLFELDLPLLDKMKPRHFTKFLAEHSSELAIFRRAYAGLKLSEGENQFEEACREIRAEVAEICLSGKYASLRSTALKLGGVVATTAAVVGTTITTAPSALIPVAGAAGVGAAAQMLCSLRDHFVSSSLEKRKNPHFVTFELGLDSPERVPSKIVPARLKKMLSRQPLEVPSLSDYHWLTPTGNGMAFSGTKIQ